MSASFGSDNGSSGQDFELNLASIIDCLTVLIAFMLASASFLSIGILDAGVAAAAATQASPNPPAVNVTVELGANHAITLKLSGKSSASTPVPASQGEWDYDGMTRQLASVRSRWPDVSAVTLTADNSIEYKDVVKSMEAIRKTIPVVLLGGF